MIEGLPSIDGRRRSFGVVAASVVLWTCACSKAHEEAAAAATPAPSAAAFAAVVAVPADAPVVATPPRREPPALDATERLGKAIFFDASLSEPAGTSCASCHDPARAFSGNHGSTNGVALGSRPGHFARRNTPSVLYMKYVPSFRFALEDDDDVLESPFGGLGWGGRADTVAEFSRLPLLDPDEMNNAGEPVVWAKLQKASYAADLAAAFPGALSGPTPAMKALGQALQAFLNSEAMSPFTSKFDDFVQGRAPLSALEMKGLKTFRDPDKGACNACHVVYDAWNRPEGSLFTNYGYDGLAVPRNRAIPANADPSRYDLGLCERKQKKVPSSATKWCISMRTPSLRNVAVRERFMHNGIFSTLRDAVAFYATRSTDPGHWYPSGQKFDDVPAKYRSHVNEVSLPYNGREGDRPVLVDEDIDAIVAFLETLTDEPYRGAVAAK